MSISTKLLALALPLAVASGCAADGFEDVSSEQTGLHRTPAANVSDLDCGLSPGLPLDSLSYRWFDPGRQWPTTSVVVGDEVYDQDAFLQLLDESPLDRARLLAELGAAQLNVAAGFDIEDIDTDIAALDFVLSVNANSDLPPLISGLDGVRGFNLEARCSSSGLANKVDNSNPIPVDRREDLFAP